jgi:RNA polymerase sigma-70 factor (ECF subfamily)
MWEEAKTYYCLCVVVPSWLILSFIRVHLRSSAVKTPLAIPGAKSLPSDANQISAVSVYYIDHQNSCKGKRRLSFHENQLIKSAQAGDADAFSRLAQGFERRIYSLALHYTRDPHDAEDLAQEVWLKAFRALDTFRGEASFYTWLRQIMVNTFLNHRRGETLHHRETRSSDEFRDDAPEKRNELSFILSERASDVEEDYERKVLVECVMQALGELTPQQRLIFLLKHREGMTYEEISKAFGCSTGTVKKSLFRAVAKLRQQLRVQSAPLEYAQCGAGRNS